MTYAMWMNEGQRVLNCTATWVVEEPNTYAFRGEINIEHLINDCIKDGKYAFIAIGKETTTVGASVLVDRFCIPHIIDKELIPCETFNIGVIDKKDTGKAIKFLKTVPGIINKQMSKIARKIHKDKKAGKFSHQPETKVIVF